MVLRTVDPNRLYTADEFMELAGSDPSWELIEGKIEWGVPPPGTRDE